MENANKGFEAVKPIIIQQSKTSTSTGLGFGVDMGQEINWGGSNPGKDLGDLLPPAPTAPPGRGRSDMLTEWFGDKLSPNLGELSLLVPLLSSIRGGRYAKPVRQAMMVVAAGQYGLNLYKRGRKWYEVHQHRNDAPGKKSYVVFVEGGSNLGSRLIDLATQQGAATMKVNNHVLTLSGNYTYEDNEDGDTVEVFSARLKPDASLQPLRLTIGEHTYRLHIKSGKPGQEQTGKDDDPNKYVGNPADRFKSYLHIECLGEDAVDALREYVETDIYPSRIHEPEEYRSDLFTWDGNSRSWENAYGSVSRSMDSVVLRKGQAEAIMDDIDNFLALEQDYKDFGATWRRGILLYGPPGGGKTSFVTALATRMEMDIFYVSLKGVKTDDDFVKAIRSVRSRSVIVFEDVDVVVPTREGDSAKTGVSLDTLLNVLDGMMTPNGALFVMTTNVIESLDDALIREGRVDMKVEVGYLDDYQAKTLTERFLKREVELPAVTRDIMPAALAGIFKKYLHDRDAAFPEIIALITGEITSSQVEI